MDSQKKNLALKHSKSSYKSLKQNDNFNGVDMYQNKLNNQLKLKPPNKQSFEDDDQYIKYFKNKPQIQQQKISSKQDILNPKSNSQQDQYSQIVVNQQSNPDLELPQLNVRPTQNSIDNTISQSTKKQTTSRQNLLKSDNKIVSNHDENKYTNQFKIEQPKQRDRVASQDSKLKTQFRGDFVKTRETSTRTKNYTLTEEEQTLYGDRTLDGYTKLDILGRGGFAIVWLCTKNGQQFAAKQMAKAQNDSFQNELSFLSNFYHNDGEIKEQYKDDNRLEYLITLYESRVTSKDVWLIFELGGATLSKSLFEMKGQFYKSERIYQMINSKLYSQFIRNSKHIKQLIIGVTKAISLFSDMKIIHSDLKPDNVLIKLNVVNEIEDIKLIDFGSVFKYDQPGGISMTTPEYMSPELLELIQNGSKYTGPSKTLIEVLSEVSCSWSVDIWSLGAIILEIIIGIPHWISFKCRVERSGKDVFTTGLFSAKGRSYDKIILKQKELCENFKKCVKSMWGNWGKQQDSELLLDLLEQMMQWNPMERISPKEILQHPYLFNNKAI